MLPFSVASFNSYLNLHHFNVIASLNLSTTTEIFFCSLLNSLKDIELVVSVGHPNVGQLLSRDILNQRLLAAQGQVKWCFVSLGFFDYLFQETVNLLNTTLGHNLEQLKFPFLWSFLSLQSHKYCKWSLVILTAVTVLYGFSLVFFLCRQEIICDTINSQFSVTCITTSSPMVFLCYCNIQWYLEMMVRKGKSLKMRQIKAAVIFHVGQINKS